MNKDYYMGKYHPNRKDTNRNGITDGEEDDDSDGKNCVMEYRSHTDPTDKDSWPGKGNIPTPKVGPSRASIKMGPQDEGDTDVFDIPSIDSVLEPINEVLEMVGFQRIQPADLVSCQPYKKE